MKFLIGLTALSLSISNLFAKNIEEEVMEVKDAVQAFFPNPTSHHIYTYIGDDCFITIHTYTSGTVYFSIDAKDVEKSYSLCPAGAGALELGYETTCMVFDSDISRMKVKQLEYNDIEFVAEGSMSAGFTGILRKNSGGIITAEINSDGAYDVSLEMDPHWGFNFTTECRNAKPRIKKGPQ